MRVRDLIERLSTLPPESEVILQKDAEGNGFKPLQHVDGDSILSDVAGEPEVFSATWSAADACMSEEDWAELLKKPRCVVLVP